MKSSKLVVIGGGGKVVLLVRRRQDRLWMFPGGRRNRKLKESPKQCLRRELREELPNLRPSAFRIWKRLSGRNAKSGKTMSDAVFLSRTASGKLTIGDREIDKAAWRRPWKIRLTATSKQIRDDLKKEGRLKY